MSSSTPDHACPRTRLRGHAGPPSATAGSCRPVRWHSFPRTRHVRRSRVVWKSGGRLQTARTRTRPCNPSGPRAWALLGIPPAANAVPHSEPGLDRMTSGPNDGEPTIALYSNLYLIYQNKCYIAGSVSRKRTQRIFMSHRWALYLSLNLLASSAIGCAVVDSRNSLPAFSLKGPPRAAVLQPEGTS